MGEPAVPDVGARARTGRPVVRNPTGKQGYRATREEREARLRELETAMIAECSDRRAARHVHAVLTKRATEAGHPETAPKLETVIGWCSEVRARWKADAAREGEDRDALKREHRERFARLYRAGSGKDGSPRVALAAAERMAQLDGFLTSSRVEHTGKDGGPVQVETMTREERQARIAELQARAAVAVPPTTVGSG